jgi:hypothetical protein
MVALSVGLPVAAPAQQAGLSEADIKAGCLYNFVKFVDWPAQALPPNSPTITVGVMGNSPVGTSLDTLNGKSVRGKTLVIRRVRDPRDGTSCQLLFVSAPESDRFRQAVDALRSASVLTVGEAEGFARSGGVINFTREGNRVHFEINPDAAARARLNISSQLLKLARIVRG